MIFTKQMKMKKINQNYKQKRKKKKKILINKHQHGERIIILFFSKLTYTIFFFYFLSKHKKLHGGSMRWNDLCYHRWIFFFTLYFLYILFYLWCVLLLHGKECWKCWLNEKERWEWRLTGMQIYEGWRMIVWNMMW